MSKRKIPATMASQHPDHAQRPYYHTTEFIGTGDEVKECFLTFSQLGVSECMWDWEGKLVDESVIEKLFSTHHAYFKENQLGKDRFLTFRIPDIKTKNEFRLGRALMVILSSANIAKQVGLHRRPLFEIIMPMVKGATEMMSLHEAFDEIAALKHSVYNFSLALKQIELIPLFEEVQLIMNSDQVLEKYLQQYQQKYGALPPYIRPFLARSDPALSAGLVPAVLATKVALSRYRKLAEKSGLEIFPIIGPGSLPFRGGINPETVTQFAKEYVGVKTVLLQSAFRYDYELDQVKKAITYLETTLPKGTAPLISGEDEKKIKKIITIFKKHYVETVALISEEISQLATQLPKRRERLQHVGAFKYARSIGKKALPRAIGFTGALYSLGVPPELIGTGRGLKEIFELGLGETLEKYYLFFKEDIVLAGSYLNKENLRQLALVNPSWNQIFLDVEYLEKYFEISLHPLTAVHQEHHQLSGQIYDKLISKQDITLDIHRAAILRRSLG